MKRFLALSLVILIAACMMFSCRKHEHTYDTKWSYDEANHWRAATCDHTDAQKSFGAHVDADADGRCDVCDYSSNSGGNNGGNEGDMLVWSPTQNVVLVAEEETSMIGKLRKHFYDNVTHIAPEIVKPGTFGPNQIIFGDLGYDITNTAYKKLDRLVDSYTLAENGESAFLIYAEGGSLAVAYSDVYSAAAAINYIIENLNFATYYASDVVATDVFNIKNFILHHLKYIGPLQTRCIFIYLDFSLQIKDQALRALPSQCL